MLLALILRFEVITRLSCTAVLGRVVGSERSLERYFRMVHAIQAREPLAILRLRLTRLLMFYHGVHFLYLGLVTDRSDLSGLVHFNPLHYEHLNSALGVPFVLMMALTDQFHLVAYVHSGGRRCTSILYDILVQKDNRCFRQPLWNEDTASRWFRAVTRALMRLTRQPLDARPHVADAIQLIAIVIMNAIRFPLSVLFLHFVFFEVHVVIYFAQHGLFYQLNGCLLYLLSQISALLYLILVVHCFPIGDLLSALFTSLMLTFVLQLSETWQLMKRYRFIRGTELQTLQAQTVRSVVLLADVSALWGKALFTIFVAGTPLTIFGLLMTTGAHWAIRDHFARVIILQPTVLFLFIIAAIHLSLAHLPVLLHRPVRRVMWSFVHESVCLTNKTNTFRHCHQSSGAPLRRRVRLALFIEHFHTDKQYGVSLGRYGQVTYASFAKHTFYYLKILIFIYRFLNLTLMDEE